jgi:hypothetical protein
MGEQTDPRIQRAIDVIVRIQRLDRLPAADTEAFMPYLRKDAALLLEAIDGPEPTWVDVFKAARSAVPQREQFTSLEIRYGHRSVNGVLDPDLGWVTAWRAQGLIVLDLHGPRGETYRRTVRLVDPSPAEILTAAKLVGLVGGVS